MAHHKAFCLHLGQSQSCSSEKKGLNFPCPPIGQFCPLELTFLIGEMGIIKIPITQNSAFVKDLVQCLGCYFETILWILHNAKYSEAWKDPCCLSNQSFLFLKPFSGASKHILGSL
jgi:hypothetical protein